MKRVYFGTDGVRGRVGTPPMTPDFVLKLGAAAGRVMKRYHRGVGAPTVLIGKDTRVSGYMLESALEAGFASSGVNTVLTGPMPTPAVAYLTRALRLDAGVVISASHNPYPDNGIKFFSSKGQKLPDEMELEMEAELEAPVACVSAAELGTASRLDSAPGRYIEFCKSTISAEVNLRGLNVYVDCAHGAAYHIAPSVLHELGAGVVTHGIEPNGLNINDGVGATHTDDLAARVLKSGCDVGISLDGDADRVIMADAYGNRYDGDSLLYVLAQDRLRTQPLKGVVGTLMSNYGLEEALAEQDIPFFRTKVGDRYVLEALKKEGWILGGEPSGHVIVLDKQTTGDGIVAALQVLSAMQRQEKSLSELTQNLRLYPQVMLNAKIAPTENWEASPAYQRAKAEVEAALVGHGRLLIRASGTEPVVRVMVEHVDESAAHGYAQHIYDALMKKTC